MVLLSRGLILRIQCLQFGFALLHSCTIGRCSTSIRGEALSVPFLALIPHARCCSTWRTSAACALCSKGVQSGQLRLLSMQPHLGKRPGLTVPRLVHMRRFPLYAYDNGGPAGYQAYRYVPYSMSIPFRRHSSLEDE